LELMIDLELSRESGADVVELHFAAGLPGFPRSHRFSVTPWGEIGSPFMTMTSIEDPSVGFIVVSPWVFYPDYDFELDEATTVKLGLVEPTDCVVLCIVTLASDPQHATVNLLGPIVVNRFTREACQTVLPTAQYNVRTPISRAA
jgi:flagellar assembly factor FliW